MQHSTGSPTHQRRTTSGARIHRVVLTGGPCGGKTTGMIRLATFFESCGWKVYRVGELATFLINGGVKFLELSPRAQFQFQEGILKSIIENQYNQMRYFALAKDSRQDCLVISDRGCMDGKAYVNNDAWEEILARNKYIEADLRENRYDQVIHMQSAALGASAFYTRANNAARSEDIEQAAHQDRATRDAWCGLSTANFTIVDNEESKSFDEKLLRMIDAVGQRAGITLLDRLAVNSVKRRWLVSAVRLPATTIEFDMEIDFLTSTLKNTRRRISKRCQNGSDQYTTTDLSYVNRQPVETMAMISARDYLALLNHRDPLRTTIYKKRNCFNYANQYYQLDTYVHPLPPQRPESCLNQLYILETYTTVKDDNLQLPDFLTIDKEITYDGAFSQYYMALKEKPTINLCAIM